MENKEPVGAIYIFIMEDGTVDVQSVYEPDQTQEILKQIANAEVSEIREIELDMEEITEEG